MKEKNSFKEFLGSSIGKVCLILVLYVLIWGIMLFIVNVFENMEYIGLVYALIFGIFGWKALNRIQPSIFLIMPLGGWLLYFVIKGVLAVVVGIFVAPFIISKKITENLQERL